MGKFGFKIEFNIFEVVRETGSVSLQSTRWGCFELKLVESYIPGAELPKSAEHSNGLLVGEQRYHKNKRI